MKAKILLLLTCVIITISKAQETGIKFFEGSWEEALYKANAYNKYIFVDAYASWCGPCKKMQSEIFPMDDVGDFYNKNFINIKLDVEKGWGIDFGVNNGVKFYPSYLFFDASGKLIHRSGSYKPASEFIEDGKNSLNPDLQYYSMIKKYDTGEKGTDFLYNYAKASLMAGGNYLEIANEYWKTQQDTALINEKNWNFIAMFTTDINSREYKYLLNNTDKFSEKYSKDKVAEKLTTVAVRNIRKAGIEKNKIQFDLIKEIISKNDSPDKKDERLLFADMTYYFNVEDWQNYGKVAVSYIEKYASNNAYMLNTVSWNFYENIDDKKLIEKAVTWAKKSVELEKSYANTDTYAAILFKSGKKEEAMQAVNEALNLAKDEGINASETEELKKKIEQL